MRTRSLVLLSGGIDSLVCLTLLMSRGSGVTCWHLAKNLGFQVAKPDRHLIRISKKAGFATPNDLCAAVAEVTGEPINVVDLVLWRYAALNRVQSAAR